MRGHTDINILISNIIDQNRYSHCRLCLKHIEDSNYASLKDSVSFPSNENHQCLDAVLTKIFGKEICTEIPALDAICSNCLNKTLETLQFIQQCESSTEKLHKILDNLNAALNTDMDLTNDDKKLYIVCGEDKSQIIFIQNKQVEETEKKTSFRCFSCKVCFDDDEELNEHVNISHGQHVCKECGKSFRGLEKLLAHEDKHGGKNECPKCGKTYTTKQFFANHVRLCLEDRVELHPMRSRQTKTYFCQECGKGYSTSGGLRVHQRFSHGNALPHVCNKCGKSFTAPCYLKAHMITHTKEKNFPCNICGGKYVSKEALLYHTRRHTGEKPYSCDICSEKFVNASSRAEHIKHKHIGPTLNCELCSRKFVTKNFLRLHMKKHYDPANKLYVGRINIPPNMPGEQNMRIKIE